MPVRNGKQNLAALVCGGFPADAGGFPRKQHGWSPGTRKGRPLCLPLPAPHGVPPRPAPRAPPATFLFLLVWPQTGPWCLVSPLGGSLCEVATELLLSRFSRVRLCATPQMAARQAPRPWESPGKNTEWVAVSFSNACMLSHACLSPVRLCVTPWTAAHQAPPSTGFSRQEYRSGVPFPSPEH